MCAKSYDLYLKQLNEWHDFGPDNKKINAVLTYIKKACLIQDLFDIKILLQDETGKLR